MYHKGYHQLTSVQHSGGSESKPVDHQISHPNNFPFPTEYEESEEYETEEDYDEGDLNGANIPNSNGIFCMYDLFSKSVFFVSISIYFCSSLFATNNYVEGDRNGIVGLHCGSEDSL